jgi:hypothetical protein
VRSRSRAVGRTPTTRTCWRRPCARALQPTPTIATNFAVYPFVGLIEPGHAWRPSAGEVAEVLELALDDLRAGRGRRRLQRRGVLFRTDSYLVGDHLVWGATARMLADLLRRVDHQEEE